MKMKKGFAFKILCVLLRAQRIEETPFVVPKRTTITRVFGSKLVGFSSMDPPGEDIELFPHRKTILKVGGKYYFY